MPAVSLLLDVIPYISSVTDAVNLIKAADIPIEHAPDWAGSPAQKLQAGLPSQRTQQLCAKRYYILLPVAQFGLLPTPQHQSVTFAKNWILGIAKHRFATRWRKISPEAQAPRGLELKPGVTPLAALASKIYADPHARTCVTCYMSGGECFVSGMNGWEPIALEKLLAAMSRVMSGVLELAYARAVIAVNSDIRRSRKLYGSSLSRDTALREELDEIGAVDLHRMAHLDHHCAHTEEIKRMLLRNKALLEEHGALVN